MVVDYAAEAASHGAVYLEGIFSPAERVRHGCSWEDVFEGVCNGAQEAKELHGVEIRLTPDIPRGFTQEEARETVEWCSRYRDRGVVGVGLGGLEAEFPPEPYEDVFALREVARPRLGAARGRGGRRRVGARRAREPPGRPAPPRHPRRGGSRARPGARRPRHRPRRLPALEPPHGRRRLARRPPAAPPRRRRRPLLDLDGRPGDVRHRPRAATTRRRPRSASIRARSTRPGVAGALCDEATRARLRRSGDSFDWAADPSR